MVLVELLDANNDVRHLRAVLPGRDDGHQSPAAMSHVDVARRPGDHAVHADVLGFPGQPAVVNHFAVFAGIGVIDFRGLDVVRRIHPIESFGVPRLFVRIVLDLVVCGPLHGDIPIAVAKDSRDQSALGRLGVRLPFGRTHQLVFPARVPRRADDLCRVFTGAVVQLLKLRIDCGKKLARAIAHDQYVVRTGGTLTCAIVKLFGTGNQVVLHLAGVILADQFHVGIVFFHQAVARRLRTAIGVDIVHLCVPGPYFGAYQRRFDGGRSRFRERRWFDVGHHCFLQVRQSGFRRNERFGNARRRNPAAAHRRAETEEKDCPDNQQQNNLRSRLQPVPCRWCGDFVVKHGDPSSACSSLDQIAVVVFLVRGRSRRLVQYPTRHRGYRCGQ